MIDEATTNSKSTTLVVCIKTTMEDKPIIFFLDPIEIEKASGRNITDKLIERLNKLVMSTEWLKEHLVCFASDEAAAMTGKSSGVAQGLGEIFPAIFTWYCANHRLELAVSDAIQDADGINNFRVFMDKLYTLYHASPKNRYELRSCARELEEQFHTIGRVLDTR